MHAATAFETIARRARASPHGSPRSPADQPARAQASKQASTRPHGACSCGGSCPRCNAPLQRKATVNTPGDAAEHEADAVADRVMRMAEAPPVGAAPPAIQRKCAACEEDDDKKLQRKESGSGDALDTGSALRAAASGGTPLPREARAFFEPRFGRDLGDVRVHDDAGSASAARDVQAHAYTVGSDIVFGAGQYAPATQAGRSLLAHELAHVLQQAGGSRSGASANAGIQRQAAPANGEVERDSEGDAADQSRNSALKSDLVPVPGLDEPGQCPGRTGLGNVAPDPPCASGAQAVDGTVILFCEDSDAFLDRGEANNLRALAQRQAHGAQFQVQAHSSMEGPGTTAQARSYNENLSCHRAKRAAHLLMDVGVPESDITITSGGPTDRFGKGDKLRHLNRNVVVGIEKPDAPEATLPRSGDLRGIADTAKQRLIAGDYAIGADGYLLRWTCGRWGSLAAAVSRTTVLVRGDPGFVNNEKGLATLQGLNTICLPDEILLEFANGVDCAMARIADLTFHHFARSEIPNFFELHAAGAHLVALAGLQGCKDIGVGKPAPVDPFQGKQPACAKNVDVGPTQTKGLPTGPVPTFSGTINPASPTTRSGTFTTDASAQRVNADPQQTPIELSGVVSTSGKPQDIDAYEVGFVQTALGDDNVASYVGGQKIIRELPLPLRDGAPPQAPTHAEAPWFDQGARTRAKPGTVEVQAIDEPNATAFTFFPNLAKTTFARVPQKGFEVVDGPTHTREATDPKSPGKKVEVQVQGFEKGPQNDIVDKIDRKLEFLTWLVARRRGAAPSRDSTQFLSGVRMTLELHPSFLAFPAGRDLRIVGSGSWKLASSTATTSDISDARLSGAVPGEFAAKHRMSGGTVPLFSEFLRSDEQVPGRDKNQGQQLSAWRSEVLRIAEAHRRGKPKLAVPLSITVKVDLATGRVILDDPVTMAARAVTVREVAGQSITDAEATNFAADVFPEIRKLVLGFAPGLQTRNSEVADLLVSLPAK